MAITRPFVIKATQALPLPSLLHAYIKIKQQGWDLRGWGLG